MRRPVRLLAVLALALVLAACRVDAVVEVEVADDGSGVVDVAVSLDDEALQRAGDLERLLATDDLAAAGWAVQAPALEADGLTWVRASKSFDQADQLTAVLAEVSPVFAIDLDRSHRFGETTLELQGTIDLSDGLDALGDDQLAELFGSASGIDVAALEDEVGSVVETSELRFVVRMPYDVSANGEVGGEEAVWVIRPGDAAVSIEADSSQRHPWTMAFGIATLFFGVGFVLVLGRRFWRVYTGADLDLDGYRPQPAQVGPVDDEPDDRPPRQLELIVLDGFGVLFDVGADLMSVLVPFVVENGGTADPVEVAERYRQASLGRLSSAEFWQQVGANGEPDRLDHELVARIELTEGALTFLERSKLQGLSVACLANGLRTWFELLRRRDSLDVYSETWLVSSELGVRKPDPAAYGAILETTGVPLGNCLMIDDRTEHLDAARRAGMSTALFGTENDDDNDHPHLESFESLLG